MSLNEVLERTCEVYLSRKLETFIELVSAANDNEEVFAIAAEEFRSSVVICRKVLANAKQMMED
jgi:hypothetical protein